MLDGDGICSYAEGASKMVGGKVMEVGDVESADAALLKLSWCLVGSESERRTLEVGVQLRDLLRMYWSRSLLGVRIVCGCPKWAE